MSWKETPFQIPRGRGDRQQRHDWDRCGCQQGRGFLIGSQTHKVDDFGESWDLGMHVVFDGIMGKDLNRPNKRSPWPRYVCAHVRSLMKVSILTWTLLYSGGGLLEAIIASSFSQQTAVFYFTGKVDYT
jgi:hypothetical protein